MNTKQPLNKTFSQTKQHTPRFAWLKREKAAIIKLRRKGYCMSTLSTAFHRSTSTIHGILKNAVSMGLVGRRDYRKMPNKTRPQSASMRHKMIEYYLPKWLQWICGEEDEPP